MGDTTGVDLLILAFKALSREEQEEAFETLGELRLAQLAGDDGLTAQVLRSLQRAAEHLGTAPNSSSYRRAWRELRDAGEAIENLTAVINHFGSWRQAREALDLSAHTSARRIEARFANRRLGKVWRYTELTLRETLQRCVDDIGHVPQVAEFEHWRERELELARARGDDAAHLPSASPYRRRYGSWEKALLKLGFTPDQVAERLERGVGARTAAPGFSEV